MYNLQQRENNVELIVGLTQLALAAPDVPSAVSPILETLVTETAAQGAAYFQIEKQEVFLARASAGTMPSGPAMEHILTHGLPGNTPLMQALERVSAPRFFDDTSHAPETAGFADLGVSSLAAAPVRDARGALLGAFLMHTFHPHEWVTAEARFFTGIAGVLAQLTARLVAEEQAVAAQEDALRALGLALDHRDGETKGHTDRVTELACHVATELGLNESDLKALRWGSYLHDIGKIGIPDGILRKPGRLDDREWNIMRTHPSTGREFAAQLGFLPASSLDLILYHHESWNGGGYPRGLSGKEIPLLARIFTICDVYDALTSVRPYKVAWSHQDAIWEIVAQAGKQFDPDIVTAFLQISFGYLEQVAA